MEILVCTTEMKPWMLYVGLFIWTFGAFLIGMKVGGMKPTETEEKKRKW